MTWFTIILLALSLSMDAMAVSITLGICKGKVRPVHALKVGLYFGAFQALMPAIGYLAATVLAGRIEPVDHWIAFVLLAFIGLKMIREATHEEVIYDEDDPSCPVGDPMSHKRLVILAVATSIDALAAGVSLAVDRSPLLVSVTVIGVVTLIMSAAAVLLGRKLGVLFQKRATVAGGLVLVLLGTRILVEHLFMT